MSEIMNQKIVDGNYDKSLAVKCINGTFVGKKADGVISFKGIPFVGQQPVGNLRWKAPVDVTPDDGVYEAYYYSKAPIQEPGDPAAEYGTSEDCLYLNVWKAAGSMVNGPLGRRTLATEGAQEWSMVNGQWSMVNGQ